MIAIKAPHGTTLEVPDPDEVCVSVQGNDIITTHAQSLHQLLSNQAVDYPQRRYRIVLRSTMGPIDVYLVRYYYLLSFFFLSFFFPLIMVFSGIFHNNGFVAYFSLPLP